MGRKDPRTWKTGISTGSCAAGAARAAARLLFTGEDSTVETVVNPAGVEIRVPVAETHCEAGLARALVIKDGGDDPDVTHGLEIVAEVRPAPAGVVIRGGTGVGTVTRPGLAVAVGESAINPVPRQMIITAVEAVCPPGCGVEVTISVPRAAEVAHRTANPRLGIVGGISILGTSGIVRPMSEEAYRDSLVPQVTMALAAGHRNLVLTPGRMGLTLAARYGLPGAAVAEMGNFVGFMLERCVEHGVAGILLWGYHGKIAKVAAGVFHTHSRVADARLETLAAYAGAAGAPPALLGAVLAANTAEEAAGLLAGEGFAAVFTTLAERASFRAAQYVQGRLRVGTVLLTLAGEIIGLDRVGQAMLEELGWAG
ncbi:MAG TPA: cobalt-precorrin-5B (C(1))-methyltransferase CbiD [Spirochaetia bacterium]|nr:cobalt-precorrin-5B (C(1))-methyltransferase CbiD [Spirochaetia bacterium]